MFETLLRQHLRTLSLVPLLSLTAGGCTGEDKVPVDVCEDDSSLDTGQYVLGEGYLRVTADESCPDAAEVTDLSYTSCCPSASFEGPVCGFVRREGDLTWDDTGFRPRPADTATPAEEVFDLCYYQALFQYNGDCCGRPLLLEEGPALAQLTRVGPAPGLGGLPREERRLAGHHWLHMARLEHASIASFARFTLDLMRWGAPPHLLLAAQEATADEVHHAQACFALAGQLLGTAHAAGVMPQLDGVTASPSLEAFVTALVLEGVIGETLAAAEASALRPLARLPEVAEVLGRIAHDEARHAALAWRTLEWVLRAHPHLASHVQALLERTPTRDAAPGLHALGVPSSTLRADVARRTLDEVVRWIGKITALSKVP